MTVDALLAAIESSPASLVERVDHAAGAADAGLTLPPTEMFVFGNPNLGTRLMQVDQRIGIDLPLKILVWERERLSKASPRRRWRLPNAA